MKQYIGCDSHSRYPVFVSVDEKGGVGTPVRVAHGGRGLRDYLDTLEKGTPVAVEASGGWYWFMDRPVEPSLGGSLAGSESVPGSLLVLAAQETVTVRVQASQSETSKWHDAGLETAKVAVTAGVMESYLDSNEYSITSSSAMIRSKNEVGVFWHH